MCFLQRKSNHDSEMLAFNKQRKEPHDTARGDGPSHGTRGCAAEPRRQGADGKGGDVDNKRANSQVRRLRPMQRSAQWQKELLTVAREYVHCAVDGAGEHIMSCTGGTCWRHMLAARVHQPASRFTSGAALARATPTTFYS